MSRLLFAAGLAVAACAGSAAPFVDPTRPPGASEAGAPTQGGAEQAALRLESVLVAPDRRIAVINGQAVRVGQKVGEARVLRITETEVTLREGTSTQVLKLYPMVERQPAGRKAKGGTK